MSDGSAVGAADEQQPHQHEQRHQEVGQGQQTSPHRDILGDVLRAMSALRGGVVMPPIRRGTAARLGLDPPRLILCRPVTDAEFVAFVAKWDEAYRRETVARV